MEQLHTAQGCRELDRLAIEGGIEGFELMQRAGRAVFEAMLQAYPRLTRLSIACGKGNNAGDGYVVARLALEQGLGVELIQVGEPGTLSGDAARARDAALAHGATITPTDDGEVRFSGDVIVDALLGTGIKGAPRDPYATLIAAINTSSLPVVAVDIPSGVLADNGAVPGPAVRADLTVTFIGRKIGLHTGAGAVLAGQVTYAGLGVGGDVLRQVDGIDWLTFDGVLTRHPLPKRQRGAYKQALGHLVVVGGDESMGGAPLMAAETALRAGVGMVTVVTRGTHRNAILSRRPEVMVLDAGDTQLRDEVFGKADAVVVGPGLGRRDWGASLLDAALALEKPMVLDADGLFHLAASGQRPAAPTIITPHAGEAGTLLGIGSSEVEGDRIAAASRLAERVGGVAVLKGPGSVVASAIGTETRCLGVCAHGNPGMATAGMGDVLSGALGGLLGQGLPVEPAALLGVCLHSLAADRAVRRTGQMSLLATDIVPEMMDILKVAID
ncbi:MAG: NAD(P)H-hydrate dehydratase [Gammaproteobacteria bacterium]